MYSETVTEAKRHYPREASPPREYRSPPGGNLQELDTLLYDLNEARYNGSYIQQRPSGEKYIDNKGPQQSRAGAGTGLTV